MRFFLNNPNPDAYYEPNSFNCPVEHPDLAEPRLTITADANRFDHRDGNDDYAQHRALFNLFDAGQKSRLFSNSPRRCRACRSSSSNAARPPFREGASGVRGGCARGGCGEGRSGGGGGVGFGLKGNNSQLALTA